MILFDVDFMGKRNVVLCKLNSLIFTLNHQLELSQAIHVSDSLLTVYLENTSSQGYLARILHPTPLSLHLFISPPKYECGRKKNSRVWLSCTDKWWNHGTEPLASSVLSSWTWQESLILSDQLTHKMDVSAFKLTERWLLDGTTRQLFQWRES